MSTVTEIEATITKLNPAEMRQIADSLAERLCAEETPAALAALDDGIRSLDTEPTVPAEEVRRKIGKTAAK